MLRSGRLFARAALIAAALLILLPVYACGRLAGGQLAGRTTRLWHRFVVRLLGIRVHVTGSPAGERPLLLLANHVSWLDISVIASVLPVSFVAKREVADWPVFGWLAKLQRSVFIDRDRPHTAAAQADAVAARLTSAEAVVLFPEGTSGDGTHILPFRSALVGAAQRAVSGSGAATVQPLAIAYARFRGLPMGRRGRPLVAWYGDMTLLPHLKRIVADGAIDVHLVFGPARQLSMAEDRKRIAAEAHRLIGMVVAAVNAGCDPATLLATPGPH